MADFRKWFLAFAALVLVLGSTVPAHAQSIGPAITCTVNSAVPTSLRAEGVTELIGDIVLICTGAPTSTGPTPPGQPMPTANITVSLSIPLAEPTVGAGTDALLLIDDPTPPTSPTGHQTVCPNPTVPLPTCQDYGDGGLTFNTVETPPKYNIFQGVPGGPAGTTNSITFLGVPVDPPATGSRVYRITNVRVQAYSAGQQLFGLYPVYAFVNSSSSTSISITETAPPVVGFVQPSLKVGATTTNYPFLQCVTYPIPPSTAPVPVGSVTFSELFASAFKIQDCVTGSTGCPDGVQNTPGLVYYTESGLQIPVTGGTTGTATQATEFQTVISNIPNGVQVYVDASATDTATGAAASLIAPTTGSGITQVLDNETGSNGSVMVVWEITSANASAIDSLTFNIYVTFTGAPGVPGSPTPNVTATEESGYSPQVSAWTGSGPIPEFINTSNQPGTPPQNLFTVSLCQTLLLFPYVTDYYGFDTGIAISNTSLDNLPVGASHQTGSCSVAFFGVNETTAGPATNIGTTGSTPGFVNSDVSYNGVPTINGTGMISPGQTWAFDLCNTDSTCDTVPPPNASGSTGYAIATCNFQYAHGYSFVSDIGIRNFAAAYLALIIPDAPRSPEPFICNTGLGMNISGGGLVGTATASATCTGQSGEQLVH